MDGERAARSTQLRVPRMLQASLIFLFSWFVGAGADPVPVSLAGSAESMARQHRVALEGGFEFLRRPADVGRAAAVPAVPSWAIR